MSEETSGTAAPANGYARIFDELFGLVTHHTAIGEVGACVRMLGEEITLIVHVLGNPWQILGFGRGLDTDEALDSLIAGLEYDVDTARYSLRVEEGNNAEGVNFALSVVRGRLISPCNLLDHDFIQELKRFVEGAVEGADPA